MCPPSPAAYPHGDGAAPQDPRTRHAGDGELRGGGVAGGNGGHVPGRGWRGSVRGGEVGQEETGEGLRRGV